MPRLPGICQECGAVYPSPLRAQGPGDAPAFDVPAPCPACGAAGRVPPEVLGRLEATVAGGARLGDDSGRLRRVVARVRAAAVEPDRELSVEEERVRRARLRAWMETEIGAGGELADGLSGFRRGEVEAFVRLLRIAAELAPGPGAEGDHVARLLEVAYDRHGPDEPVEAAPDPARRARARLRAAGRNDPCPCGSGEKYKDCHWVADLRETR